ncbi:hypothetical protein C8F04DRAFT_1234592 [Mycena alexandri]|uniref:Uncharacterized protein n=1 Tax=Mycena alexandri TaxID=1745969 RepID=A0AAD6STJ4_9AGAR|nr:hypothetical protein C8F04DRAFT_1234592 [Mycena alexandri]
MCGFGNLPPGTSLFYSASSLFTILLRCCRSCLSLAYVETEGGPEVRKLGGYLILWLEIHKHTTRKSPKFPFAGTSSPPYIIAWDLSAPQPANTVRGRGWRVSLSCCNAAGAPVCLTFSHHTGSPGGPRRPATYTASKTRWVLATDYSLGLVAKSSADL